MRPKTVVQSRKPRSSTCFPEFSADRIKETNPRRTALLWRQVTTPKPPLKPPRYTHTTTASQAKTNPRSNKSILSQEYTAKTESLAQISKTQEPKNTTIRDVDFEDTQLIPRGIEIHKKGMPSWAQLEGLTLILTWRHPRTRTNHANFTKVSFKRVLPAELTETSMTRYSYRWVLNLSNQ